jgi:hypothetical protein
MLPNDYSASSVPTDGYTLLLGGTLPHVNEALIKARPLYDPVNLEPIAGVAVAVLALARARHMAGSATMPQFNVRTGQTLHLSVE